MDDQTDFGSIGEVGDSFFVQILKDCIDPLDRMAVKQFINALVSDVHDGLGQRFVTCMEVFEVFG